MEDTGKKPGVPIALMMFSIVLFLTGGLLAVGGAYLIYLGGSAYYLPAGVGLLASGILICRGRLLGIWIYTAVFLLTCIWAAIETKLDFWAMVSRTAAPLALAIVALFLVPMFRSPRPTRGVRNLSIGAGCALAAGFAILLVQMTYPHGVIYNENLPLTRGPVSAGALANAGLSRTLSRGKDR